LTPRTPVLGTLVLERLTSVTYGRAGCGGARGRETFGRREATVLKLA
jgi:hypothetical protein